LVPIGLRGAGGDAPRTPTRSHKVKSKPPLPRARACLPVRDAGETRDRPMPLTSVVRGDCGSRARAAARRSRAERGVIVQDFAFRGNSAANRLLSFRDHGTGRGVGGTTRTERARLGPAHQRGAPHRRHCLTRPRREVLLHAGKHPASLKVAQSGPVGRLSLGVRDSSGGIHSPGRSEDQGGCRCSDWPDERDGCRARGE
jgi:hypothetical protein